MSTVSSTENEMIRYELTQSEIICSTSYLTESERIYRPIDWK